MSIPPSAVSLSKEEISRRASFPTTTSGASELETIKPNNLKVKTSPIYGEQISTALSIAVTRSGGENPLLLHLKRRIATHL